MSLEALLTAALLDAVTRRPDPRKQVRDILTGDYNLLVLPSVELLDDELRDTITACFPDGPPPSKPVPVPAIILDDPQSGMPVLVMALSREHVDPIRYVQALERLGVQRELDHVLSGPDRVVYSTSMADASKGLRALEHATGRSLNVQGVQVIDTPHEVRDDDDLEPDVNPAGLDAVLGQALRPDPRCPYPMNKDASDMVAGRVG